MLSYFHRIYYTWRGKREAFHYKHIYKIFILLCFGLHPVWNHWDWKGMERKCQFYFFILKHFSCDVACACFQVFQMNKIVQFGNWTKVSKYKIKFSAKHKIGLILLQRFKAIICALVCAYHRIQRPPKWQSGSPCHSSGGGFFSCLHGEPCANHC